MTTTAADSEYADAGAALSGRVRPHRMRTAHRLYSPLQGDCLFTGGAGNTQQDASRFKALFKGVRDTVFGRLRDSTWVYPGHGSDTTLGAERPHMDEWGERGW